MKKSLRKKSKKINKTRKRGGGIGTSALSAILFSLFVVSDSKHYYMTACAGNTCRSPMAAEMLKTVVPRDQVSSFGVNVRAPGSQMAPLTEQIALDLCNYDTVCVNNVKNHKSQSFDPIMVHTILEDPENTLQIIPMDDKTANGVYDLLKRNNFTDDELVRIKVGVGEHISANAPDPFFAKGTHFEVGAYGNTSSILSDFVKNEVFGQTPMKEKKWKQEGNTLKQYIINNNKINNRQRKTSR